MTDTLFAHVKMGEWMRQKRKEEPVQRGCVEHKILTMQPLSLEDNHLAIIKYR